MVNRNQYLDIVKGITMLLVIYGHAIEASAGAGARATLAFFRDPVHDFIFSFHMPLFMLVSGYLFYSSFLRHDTRYMVISRLRSLLIPILSYGVVVAFIKLDYSNLSLINIVKAIVVATASNLWFLYAVLVLSILALFIERRLQGSLGGYFLTMCLSLFVPPMKYLLFSQEIAFMWPFFIAGMAFKKYNIQVRLDISRLIFVLAFIVIVFCILFHYYNDSSYIYTSGMFVLERSEVTGAITMDWHQLLVDLYRWLIGFVGSGMVLLLVYGVPKWINASCSYIRDTLALTGEKSMGMYCLHFIGTIYLDNISANNLGINLGYALFCSFALYAFAMFFTRFFEQWKVTRVLFLGGR